MSDPAKSSRRLQAVRRRAWRAGAESHTEEEARAYLQTRLAVFSKLVFWAFVSLLVFLFGLYTLYPPMKPQYQDVIYGVAVIALAMLALIWRGLLERKKLSVDVLYGLDLLITIGSGVCFATVAALAYDRQASSYTCLLFVSFTIFTRALVVPSSAKRTFVTSTLAFIPIAAGAVLLGFIAHFEVPGPAFVVGGLLYNAVAIILATLGSEIRDAHDHDRSQRPLNVSPG